jgi:hypothetical protein
MQTARAVAVSVVLALAAAAPANPVVEENRKPGTRDWLLKNLEPVVVKSNDDHFQRRRAIEGYCSHPSIRAGQTLTVFVSTTPPGEYKADIYRPGFYNGDGGRLLRSVEPRDGTQQPDPRDGPKKLIEANWKPSFELKIPTDWVSGVYLGKLTKLDTGYEAYFVFIVRDDRKADYLFQCSDLTWQAYNRWPGWRSLYDWNNNKWHTTVGADVGFDRPYSIYYNGLPARFNPLTNGSGEFLLWEFPLAFWMEQHGYDLTYISNIDTHADAAGLLRARGFLSVGHDEYWTQQMFDNVSKARDAGVNLAFFSGNSISGRVYLNPSTDGRPNRVFGRIEEFKNEQDLMGAASYGVGMTDWTCVNEDHWVFEGTGMKKGDAIPRLVGWEFHGHPLREDHNLVVLAEGKAKATMGGDTYAATIYPGPKGNFVFNAATCWWSMVLSKPPGFVNPPGVDFSEDDPRVQRMTKNILERMKNTSRDGPAR